MYVEGRDKRFSFWTRVYLLETPITVELVPNLFRECEGVLINSVAGNGSASLCTITYRPTEYGQRPCSYESYIVGPYPYVISPDHHPELLELKVVDRFLLSYTPANLGPKEFLDLLTCPNWELFVDERLHSIAFFVGIPGLPVQIDIEEDLFRQLNKEGFLSPQYETLEEPHLYHNRYVITNQGLLLCGQNMRDEK